MPSTPPPPYNGYPNGGQNGGNGNGSSSPSHLLSPKPQEAVSGIKITPEELTSPVKFYLNGPASHKVNVLNLQFEKPGSYNVNLSFPQGATIPQPFVDHKVINFHVKKGQPNHHHDKHPQPR